MILNDEQYAHVRSNAGLVPLSTWFRNLALTYADSLQTNQYIEIKDGKVSEVEVVPLTQTWSEPPLVSKRPNHYCKPHRVIGCVADGCRLGT